MLVVECPSLCGVLGFGVYLEMDERVANARLGGFGGYL